MVALWTAALIVPYGTKPRESWIPAIDPTFRTEAPRRRGRYGTASLVPASAKARAMAAPTPLPGAHDDRDAIGQAEALQDRHGSFGSLQ